MKKAIALMTLLVLTICAMTGCGCRNSKPAATIPTTLPTVTTAPTTEATTAPTTMPSTAATEPTVPDGNGPLPTDGSEEATAPNERSANLPGSGIGITGSITG